MSAEEYEALETARIDPAARGVLKKVLERAQEIEEAPKPKPERKAEPKLKDEVTREEALNMLDAVVERLEKAPTVEIAMEYEKPIDPEGEPKP